MSLIIFQKGNEDFEHYLNQIISFNDNDSEIKIKIIDTDLTIKYKNQGNSEVFYCKIISDSELADFTDLLTHDEQIDFGRIKSLLNDLNIDIKQEVVICIHWNCDSMKDILNNKIREGGQIDSNNLPDYKKIIYKLNKLLIKEGINNFRFAFFGSLATFSNDDFIEKIKNQWAEVKAEFDENSKDIISLDNAINQLTQPITDPTKN